MADATAIWAEVMPVVKNKVTGVGLWQALNHSVAIVHENGQLVIGLPHEMGELAGHLRVQATRTLIERELADHLNAVVTLRVIEGTDISDWEVVKRKDEEARKMQQAAMARVAAEAKARGSWDTVYEQITRHFATVGNRSLPQNRAKFFEDSLDMLTEALKTHPIDDDLSERNFARCIERVAQYSEVPSVLVSYHLNQRHKGA